MADSTRGKKLTEQYRNQQLAVRARFLVEYMDLWNLLNPDKLDETGAAWVRAVMEQVRKYRDQSADLAETYFRDFRMAEAPTETLLIRPPVRSLVVPSLRKRDEAASTGLIVTGPVNIKSKIKRGKTVTLAAKEALVESSGAATRSVLEGGRETHLALVQADDGALGWARVTDGDPCAFCAMLSGRGPIYKSEQSAETVVNPGAKRALGSAYHDHCACVGEAVYTANQAWPGRSREFEALWADTTKGLSGKNARNAFRRAYERGVREDRQQKKAG